LTRCSSDSESLRSSGWACRSPPPPPPPDPIAVALLAVFPSSSISLRYPVAQGIRLPNKC
jgi:hypothetical protein